jgi:ferredoxin-type protein NapH
LSAVWQDWVWYFSNYVLYYLLAIPLAFLLKDRRAFCKILCPVSLVMKVQTRISLRSIEPTGTQCIGCGKCNKNCPMDVDVMAAIRAGERLRDSECILTLACPVGAI